MHVHDMSIRSLEAEMALDEAFGDFLLAESLRATSQAAILFTRIIAAQAAAAESKRRRRYVVAHTHPGHILDFMADSARPGGCVPASALWSNLSPEMEAKRYVESFRLLWRRVPSPLLALGLS
jgi:hypothetical protein